MRGLFQRPESRILFHRKVAGRVKTPVPFLRFDDGPYVVLVGEGLYWISDGYTTSHKKPGLRPLTCEERVVIRDKKAHHFPIDAPYDVLPAAKPIPNMPYIRFAVFKSPFFHLGQILNVIQV